MQEALAHKGNLLEAPYDEHFRLSNTDNQGQKIPKSPSLQC